MAFDKQKYQQDQLQLRHHAARYAWKRRFERTPSGITWARWFDKKFGLTLEEYADWLREHNTNASA